MSVKQSLLLDSFQIYILNLTVVGYLIQKAFFHQTQTGGMKYLGTASIPVVE